MSTLRFDAELIRRYDRAGPRYTSYPTAVQFHPGFGETAYREAVRKNEEHAATVPLSLYVHIPFCASPCFYCACNRIITRSRDRAHAYLIRLRREIELQARLFHRSRPVEQLHFGGGTPTFLCAEELDAVVAELRRHFSLTDTADREYSIEIDPRTVDSSYVHALAAMGFNRMSLGIQDFDPAVQRAINRIQPIAETLRVVDAAREAGIRSISFDLIYGLPRQTLSGFEHTLEAVLRARPDRLAVYAYAHMPHVFKAQRRLSTQDLPTPAVRLALLGLTVERLTAAGYMYVGMDHFALPGDELVRAKAERTLQRNFQGYSTRAHCDLVGLGVSAISNVGDTYAQNCKLLPDYYAAIDAGHLAVQRGVQLNEDDRVRAAVIQELMCHESVDIAAIEREFRIDFQSYFARELGELRKLEADGLAWLCGARLGITDRGRLLMRNVAMTFDAYADRQPAVTAFSRVI
jgi:oxygen-independent coproporphyrinogen III oxidase